MHKPRTWRHVVATLAVATVAFASTPATAQTTDESPTPENLGWGVSPGSTSGEAERSNFTFEVFPGQVIEDTVSVTNFTDEPIDFRLWSGDGYNTEDGAFAIYGADVAPLDTGSWVTLPVETLTVNPNSRADVPFSITIPANASPGDHVGGIAALNTSSPEQLPADGTDLDLLRAIGARIYLRVAGDLRTDVEIRDLHVSSTTSAVPIFGGGTVTLEYRVVNTGNLRISPTTSAELDGPFGIDLRGGEQIQLRELLPGSEITVRQEWDGVPALGRLTARATATAGDVEVVREQTVWAIPWTLLLLLALLGGGIVLWRRRRRRQGPGVEDAEAEDDEELIPA